MDYFDRLGVAAVGLGWLTLHRTDAHDPSVTVEDWPHPIEQPIGPAVAARLDAVGLEQRLTDSELQATPWIVAPDVVQETVGPPGAADPSAVVLRQQRGFGRVIQADTALAALVGACDGELPLGVLIGAVASLLAAEPAELRSALLPEIRDLIVSGFVLPCGSEQG